MAYHDKTITEEPDNYPALLTDSVEAGEMGMFDQTPESNRSNSINERSQILQHKITLREKSVALRRSEFVTIGNNDLTGGFQFVQN